MGPANISIHHAVGIMNKIVGGTLFSFPPGTEMFHFPGFAPRFELRSGYPAFLRDEFPHSDITGSKVARHLPGAYRSQATSFIAFRNQGIHHTPLCSPLENAHILCVLYYLFFVLNCQSPVVQKS